MSFRGIIKNAEVTFVKRTGKNLNVSLSTFNKVGTKNGKPEFERVSLKASIFDAKEELAIDKGDKIDIAGGQVKLESNPNIKQVHQTSGKEYPSAFPVLRAFASDVTVVAKGDRTTTRADTQARTVSKPRASDTRPVPTGDHDDDDLPF